jgi:hypothetical protein
VSDNKFNTISGGSENSISGGTGNTIIGGHRNRIGSLNPQPPKEPEVLKSEEPAKNQKDWYQKPIGIIWLSVCGIFIATCLVWGVNHYFNLGL